MRTRQRAPKEQRQLREQVAMEAASEVVTKVLFYNEISEATCPEEEEVNVDK